MTIKVIDQQRIERLSDGFSNERPGCRPARLIQGLEFKRCYFHDCSLSMTRHPELRTTVRDVRLDRCEVEHCFIESAIIEDCIVDGLKTLGDLKICGAVFKHVVLRGKIDKVMITHPWSPYLSDEPPDADLPIRRANAEYYKHVDWALDISQGEFQELDIRSVPARLIRRDPETQVIVTREKALQGDWKYLPYPDNLWAGWIDGFLHDETPDVVLVAPKRSKRFKPLLEGLKLLRQAGVAEPD